VAPEFNTPHCEKENPKRTERRAPDNFGYNHSEREEVLKRPTDDQWMRLRIPNKGEAEKRPKGQTK